MGVLEERQVADDRWRQEVDRRLDEHMERLDNGDLRMTQLARSIAEAKIAIDEGNKMTEGVKKNTDVFVTWVKNVTGFNNVVNLVFSVLIKASIVVVAAGILWYFVTERQLPRKAQAPVATEHHG